MFNVRHSFVLITLWRIFIFVNVGFGQSVAHEGYLIWPGGLIMQWGTLTGDQGNLGAGYPIAFKELVFQALTSMNDKTAGAVDGITLYVPTANLANKTSLIALNKGKDLQGTVTASYFVIGK
ncbi:gp53-like domain-containing protein [Citrobacter sp. RHBSTW-00271]|uniref:gp53-like domain-containing protein n=1 Tax=Citrobacter sp. RHBSTW-00271 TaxID=2742642 RepID=UPI00406D1F9B